MSRRRNQEQLWVRTECRLARLGPVAGSLVVCLLLFTAVEARANSWCDLVGSSGSAIGASQASAVELLDLALNPKLEVTVRETATLSLCRVAKKGDPGVTEALVILTTDGEPTLRAASLQICRFWPSWVPKIIGMLPFARSMTSHRGCA